MNTTLKSGGARWPTGTDYARAIQHAQTAFGDHALQTATVAKNMLGVPLVASGQNAVVFLLRASGSDQAVRCFTTPPTDGSSRYSALTAHLANTTRTAMTASRWLDDGIRVDEGRWPVVVMPWIEGRPFNLVVEDLAGDGAGLRRMADAWVAMVIELQHADVTHGDLQHGNVLVRSDGTFCLVDLDGSWVPTMSVGAPDESGHPNYQHPRRSASQWGRNGDSFSALVVEVGLRALAADSSLERFLTGENILFNRQDLLDTSREIWKVIAASPDPTVIALARILQQRASDRPEASMIPFERLRAGEVAEVLRPPIPSSTTGAGLPPLGAPTAGGDWWQSAGGTAPSSLPPMASTPSTSTSPATVGTGSTAATITPPVSASTSQQRGIGALLGRDAAVSGAIGGAIAALLGSLVAGAIGRALSPNAVPAVYVAVVALMIGAFLVSWQALVSGAYRAAGRRAVIGGVLGAGAGLLTLLPANLIYSTAKTQIGTVIFEGDRYRVYDMGAARSGLVWLIVAAVIGLLVGALRGAKAAIAAMLGGAVAGFVGGLLFGANVAEFRGHLLLVDGLDPATFVIVAAIGLVIGLAIGLTGRTLSRGRLVIIEGRQQGMETLLPAKTGSIGTSARNTLVLVGDTAVAEHHVDIDLRGREPLATVPSECNPIRVNGIETKHAQLKDGDVLAIGASFVRFEWKGRDS